MIRLVASDIDGTLLDEKGRVSPEVLRTIAALEARGIPIVLVSGRAPRTARLIHEQLEITSPIVCYNGAMIYDPLTGERLEHWYMPGSTAMRVLECLRSVASGVNVTVEVDDVWSVDCIDARLQRILTSGRAPVPPKVIPAEEVVSIPGCKVSKLLFTLPFAVREEFEAALAERDLADSVHVTSSGGEFVEIAAGGVDKGRAITVLTGRMGIAPEQVLALGNGENDIPMLKVAGVSVAMGNSPEPVKEASDWVTASNNEGGWSTAIHRFVLGETA